MSQSSHNATSSPLTEWLESRSNFLFVCFLIVAAAIVLVSCLRDPVDFDSWWHLKMGQDLIELGLSPYRDHYSFTFLDETISQPPVIFQVGYYFLNVWFGERGGQVALKLIMFAALFVAFLLWFKQLKSPLWVRFLVLAVLITAIQARMQIRPELFSYTLTVIAFMLYWRASQSFHWRTLVPVAMLLLFWVNYHNPLFGYIIFFGLFVDVAIRFLHERADFSAWLRWAGWGLLLVGLGFIRPDGEHFLLAWLAFSPEWRDNIVEYFAPWQYLKFPPAYAWMLLAATATVLALLQRRWGYLIILAVFLINAFSMSRMIVPTMIVMLAILAHCLTDFMALAGTGGIQKPSQRIIAVGGTIIALGAVSFGFITALTFLSENRTKLNNVPVSAVDYLEEIEAKGAIFNAYQTGGYLLYRLGPDLKVYIDGRTAILYPIEHFLHYKTALETEGVFLEEVERYNIEFALLPNNEGVGRMMHNADFLLDYSHATMSVYRRGEGRFATLGELSTFPYCSSQLDGNEMQAEAMLGLEANSDVAFINSLMALAYNYETAADRRAFLRELSPGQLTQRPTRRLFAALALKHGIDDKGVAALDQLEFQLPRDMLAAVLMQLRQGDRRGAIERLRFALLEFKDWEYVYQRDLELLALALAELDPLGTENLISAEARAELTAAVRLPAGVERFSDVPAEAFCSVIPWSGPD